MVLQKSVLDINEFLCSGFRPLMITNFNNTRRFVTGSYEPVLDHVTGESAFSSLVIFRRSLSGQ